MTADTLIDGLTPRPEPDAAAVVALITSRFPGAVVWFGTRTGHWWAMFGATGREQLFEGTDPDEITGAIINRLRHPSGVAAQPSCSPSRPYDSRPGWL